MTGQIDTKVLGLNLSSLRIDQYSPVQRLVLTVAFGLLGLSLTVGGGVLRLEWALQHITCCFLASCSAGHMSCSQAAWADQHAHAVLAQGCQ